MVIGKSTAASLLGVAMLFGVSALHASGYSYVAETLQQSDLPDFFKRILPPVFMYPSVLMVMLALAVLISLRYGTARTSILALVAIIVATNAIFGFVLGGPVPGGVLLVAAALFAYAWLQSKEPPAEAPA